MSEAQETFTVPPPLGYGTPAFTYVVVCSVSLAAMLLIQMGQGQGPVASLLLLLVGGLGVLTRIRLAPLLLLFLVAMSEFLRHIFDFGFHLRSDSQSGPTIHVTDVLLSAAVLGYVVGHYRLQGLHRHIFPPDYRLLGVLRSIKVEGTWRRPRIERHRSVHAVTALEQALLFLALPAFALLGELAWLVVAQPRNVLEWDPWVARLAVLIVALVLGLVTVAALLGTWRRRRMTLDEARLLMQDTLWNETRGEQRWFTRWLAWFWLKERERKEQP